MARSEWRPTNKTKSRYQHNLQAEGQSYSQRISFLNCEIIPPLVIYSNRKRRRSWPSTNVESVRQATTTRKSLPKDSRFNVSPGLREPSLHYIPRKLRSTAINSSNMDRAHIWVGHLIESHCNKIMIE